MFVFVCYALLCVLSGLAIRLKRRRELVVLLLLYNGCLVAVGILLLFLIDITLFFICFLTFCQRYAEY